jgi:hypothetical protein
MPKCSGQTFQTYESEYISGCPGIRTQFAIGAAMGHP